METLSMWTEEERFMSVQAISYGKNKLYVTDHEQ